MTKLTEQNADYRNEIKIQAIVNHPHIITLHGWFIGSAPSKKWRSLREDIIGSNDQCIYMILDFAEKGELLGYIRKNTLDEITILSIGKQLASAIEYCHAAGIMHRDIKLENILVDSVIDGIPQVKISDFGLATTRIECQEYAGTLDYMAPEMLQGSKYTREVDLWSLGIVIYELSQGKFPFDSVSEPHLSQDDQESSDEKLEQRIIQGDVDYTEFKSEKIKGIVSILLNMEPTQRVLRRRTR